MVQNKNPKDIVYSPSEISGLVLETIKERQLDPDGGVKTHISVLDKVINPWRPGDLVVIMAYTSNGKSSLVQYIARKEAGRIVNEQMGGEVVVIVTWEMAIEEMGMYDIASLTKIPSDKLMQGRIEDADWRALEAAAMKRSATPIWLIGHSIKNRKKRPNLSLESVRESLTWIEDNMHLHPRVIFLDHLQLIPGSRPGMTKQERCMENMDAAKDLAYALGCPVVLAVQAGREVTRRDWKMPQIADGQWTSNIEQATDKIISMWYPKTTEPLGSIVPNTNLECMMDLMLVQLLKQRGGDACLWWPLHFKPELNDFAPMDVTNTPLNDWH